MAIAAFSPVITAFFESHFGKGKLMEMVLYQSELSGDIVPGDTIPLHTTIENFGTQDCLAFMKVTSASVDGEIIYSLSPSAGWSVVSESEGAVVYGWQGGLAPDDQTGPLSDSISMRKINGSVFRELDDINFRITGYLADTEEYGEEISSAWSRIE